MATRAELIAAVNAQIAEVDAAIHEVALGKVSSYSISGGGASRSKTFLSLSELQAYRQELVAQRTKLSGRKNLYAAFGQVRSG